MPKRLTEKQKQLRVRAARKTGKGWHWDDQRKIVLKLGCRFQGVTTEDVRSVFRVGGRRARDIIAMLVEEGSLIKTPRQRTNSSANRGRPMFVYQTHADLFEQYV